MNILTQYFLNYLKIESNIKPFIHKDDSLKNINSVNRVRLPSTEQGAFTPVGKVLNFDFSKLRIFPLSAQTVWNEDFKEVDVYCREKIFSDEIDIDAIDQTFSFFFEIIKGDQIQFLPIIDWEHCFNVLPKSTSSGFPLYKQKNNNDNMVYTYNKFNEFFNHFDFKHLYRFITFYPTTIFHRFTPKMTKKNFFKFKYELKYKVRQIFGVSHIISLIEVALLSNFLSNLKNSLSNYHTLGLRKIEVSERIQMVRSTAFVQKRVILCGDISGCDKSVIPNFHNALFGFWLEAAKSSRYYPHLKSLLLYLRDTPILMKGGIQKTSFGSTTSGSWTTSIFTTFVIFISTCYCYFCIYNRFPSFNEFQLQGDDFILVIDSENDIDLFKSLFLELNLRVKADKKLVSSPEGDIEFLGYYWDYLGRPFQTSSWIVSRIVFPERRVELSGPDRLIYRYLSIIFQLREFYSLYCKFLEHDLFLKKKVIREKVPIFQIVDNVGRITNAKFPIQKFCTEGWTAF